MDHSAITARKRWGIDVTKYTMSGAAADAHKPERAERTARRAAGGFLNFDVIFQVWPSRAAMARSIRMQEARAPNQMDWRACVKLGLSEGY